VIRVAVVDDQELVRDGFALLLAAQEDIEVVGTATNGVDAVNLCRDTPVDVVLMDIRMPDMDGLDATARILADNPHAKVLVLTTFALDDYVVRALQSGASGFLLKDSPRDSLFASVRAVAAGDVMVDAQVMRALVSTHLATPAPTPTRQVALTRMTPRERDVLHHVARGLSNTEIVNTLHISETTVKTHVGRLLSKWGARDRIRLVVLAHQAGLNQD
jgi:DNA-binding NarL/FixJ family response regulator